MKIDTPLIMKIAKLSSLEVQPNEVQPMIDKLQKIVDYVEVLSTLPEQPASADQQNSPNHEQNDVPHQSLSSDDALSGTTEKVGTAFKVPRILEN